MDSPRCIASTGKASDGVEAGRDDRGSPTLEARNNFYKEAQWSSDGTCLITNSADNNIRTYVVPPNLLDESKQPHHLTSYAVIESSEPVKAYDCYTGYSLADPSTTLILSSQRDHPIRLNNALDGSKAASYPLVNPMTETFISPHSLIFSCGGSKFVAGSEDLISVFDVSRVGQSPVSYLPTSSRKSQDEVMGMKGIVSALTIDEATGILAAGTFSRHVGLYDNSGQGECVGVFCVEGTDADKHIGGAGITQVSWSEDGRYLYIVERKSDGVMFYDIRKTGQLLGWLVGRNAKTNQRLGVDVICSQNSTGVWAGGSDGMIRKWLNPQEQEGAVEVHMEFQGHDGKLHPPARGIS
jgi:telomerase Cajal body protein 1